VDTWDSFAVISGGSAGALVGLLFVAVSLRIDYISKSAELRYRAAQTLGLFVTVLLIALLLVVPGQPLRVLGLELLVVGLATGGFLSALGRRADAERSDQRLARVVEAVSPNWLTSLCVAGSGIVLLCGAQAGRYVLLPPIFAALVGGVVNAWLFLTKTPD
jgi:hypothetical protein